MAGMENEKHDAVALQQQDWKQLKDNLDSLLQNLRDRPVLEVYDDLLTVNVLRGGKLIVCSILKSQQRYNNSEKIAALTSLLNALVPQIGFLLLRESTLRFLSAFKANDARNCYLLAALLAQLFNYEIAHEIVILQILHLVMEHPNADSIGLAMYILSKCGKQLMITSRTAHDFIYESLRRYFQDEKVGSRAFHQFESLFDLRKRDYGGSWSKIKIPEHEIITHTFLLDLNDDKTAPATDLDRFCYDPEYVKKDTEFEELKRKGSFKKEKKSPPVNQASTDDKTHSKELELKKKIYLTLKGSLSGDEAAHKLLKMKIPDVEKKDVVDILVMACSQEATYSKFYGIIAERLCSSHRSWKIAFELSFHANYEAVDDFQATQVRNMGKFWGHILASDYVGFEVLKSVHMNAQETSPASRVYLKFLFQELVLDLGIEALKARLTEPYIQPFLTNIFPVDDVEKTRFSINYFTAIGLGPLTDGMRQELDNCEGGNSTIQGDRDQGNPSKNIVSSSHESAVTNNNQPYRSTSQMHGTPDAGFRGMRRRSRSPTIRQSTSPIRRRSRTPTKRRSRTPIRRRSRTPTRRTSRSPRRRSTSPKMPKS